MNQEMPTVFDRLQSISFGLRMAYAEMGSLRLEIAGLPADLLNDYYDRLEEIDSLLAVFIAQTGHDIDGERTTK